MTEFGALGEIQYHRLLGVDAGNLFIKKHGFAEAMKEAHRISNNQSPMPSEYGFIDGFMNAIADRL